VAPALPMAGDRADESRHEASACWYGLCRIQGPSAMQHNCRRQAVGRAGQRRSQRMNRPFWPLAPGSEAGRLRLGLGPREAWPRGGGTRPPHRLAVVFREGRWHPPSVSPRAASPCSPQVDREASSAVSTKNDRSSRPACSSRLARKPTKTPPPPGDATSGTPSERPSRWWRLEKGAPHQTASKLVQSGGPSPRSQAVAKSPFWGEVRQARAASQSWAPAQGTGSPEPSWQWSPGRTRTASLESPNGRRYACTPRAFLHRRLGSPRLTALACPAGCCSASVLPSLGPAFLGGLTSRLFLVWLFSRTCLSRCWAVAVF